MPLIEVDEAEFERFNAEYKALKALMRRYLDWADSCDYLLPHHEALKKDAHSLLKPENTK